MICNRCEAKVAPADRDAHSAVCPGERDWYAVADRLVNQTEHLNDPRSAMVTILRREFGRPSPPGEPLENVAHSVSRRLDEIAELLLADCRIVNAEQVEECARRLRSALAAPPGEQGGAALEALERLEHVADRVKNSLDMGNYYRVSGESMIALRDAMSSLRSALTSRGEGG